MKMRYIIITCICLICVFTINPYVYGYKKLNAVCSTLDMADFVKEIGGEHVNVYSISKGKVDLHYFEPRPSHIMKLQKADILVIGGMDLDIWIRSLIDASRNSKIKFGSTGYIDPSDGITSLDVPQGRIDGSMGDVHPYGNPHYWFTEQNIMIAIENIYLGLSRIDPVHKDYYLERKRSYGKKVQAAYDRLKKKIMPYKGTKVIQFHKSWDYFCQAFELDIIGELEPKPGITPSPAHLKEIVDLVKLEGAKLLLAEPYYPKKPIEFIQKNTGIKVLRLPNYLGSKKDIDTYLKNLEYNIETIVESLREK